MGNPGFSCVKCIHNNPLYLLKATGRHCISCISELPFSPMGFAWQEMGQSLSGFVTGGHFFQDGVFVR